MCAVCADSVHLGSTGLEASSCLLWKLGHITMEASETLRPAVYPLGSDCSSPSPALLPPGPILLTWNLGGGGGRAGGGVVLHFFFLFLLAAPT